MDIFQSDMNRNPKEAEKFAALMGAKTVSRYDEMAGLVDGVAFGPARQGERGGVQINYLNH